MLKLTLLCNLFEVFTRNSKMTSEERILFLRCYKVLQFLRKTLKILDKEFIGPRWLLDLWVSQSFGTIVT